jgi:hypothetical protein
MATDWTKVANSILTIAQAAPGYIGMAATVISAVETVYSEVRSELSNKDQAAIDQALADAKAADAAATARADTALDEAATK